MFLESIGSMYRLLALLLLLPFWAFAQSDTVMVSKPFLGSEKTEKVFSVLKVDTSVLHGLYKAYHPNGRLFLIGQYYYGLRNGEWKSFHENGTLETICFYCNGKYCKEWKYYSQDGKLESFFYMDSISSYSRNDESWSIFYKRLSKNTVYPEVAREMGISGVVEVLISRDSSCKSSIHLLKGFFPDCDNEALKAVRKSLDETKIYPCKKEKKLIAVRFFAD